MSRTNGLCVFEAAWPGSSEGQTIGNRMTMGKICAFGVCVIGVDHQESSVFDKPGSMLIVEDRLQMIEVRESTEACVKQRAVC